MAFGRAEVVCGVADGLPEFVEGACGSALEVGLELGEGHSIGLKSGLYGGRKRSSAPAPWMASRTAALRWQARLSITTMSPGLYSKNRDRLVAGDVAARFLQAVLQGERVRRLLSEEHFSVDGTLIEAWASMKSFRPREGGDDDAQASGGRNAERDFRGERRSNATHASVTDADARLYRKGQGQSSRLCFMGHLLMENGNALIVDAALTEASGTAERDAALAMVGRRRKGRRTTLGADKAYDVSDFVDALRALTVTPHITVDGHVTKTGKRRKTRIDRRTTRHAGYAVSQRLRKRIEEGFGWIKTTGGLAKTRHRGLDRVGWMFALTAAAYNLVRLPKLMAEAAI